MLPLLARAESQVANIRVRSQGTLGGNLCFNDPHSDPATVLLVHGAHIKIVGPNGTRQIPLDQFLLGMYSTSLEPDELLMSVDVPAIAGGVRRCLSAHPSLATTDVGCCRGGFASRRISRRVPIGSRMRRTDGGKTYRTRSQVSRRRSHRYSRGNSGKLIVFETTVNPIDDLLGSADYKIYITGVLLERALQQAVQDAERKQDQKND